MAFILGIIGGVQMLVTVARAGIDAQENVGKLKDQIADVNKKNVALKQKYAQITDVIINRNQELTNEIIQLNNQYIDISSKLRAYQQNFGEAFKKIQLIGIIFIIVVFALLLLKQFGLLDVIIYYLDLPFVWLWHTISGTKSSPVKKASST